MQAPLPTNLHVMAALNPADAHQQVVGFRRLFVLAPWHVTEAHSTP